MMVASLKFSSAIQFKKIISSTSIAMPGIDLCRLVSTLNDYTLNTMDPLWLKLRRIYSRRSIQKKTKAQFHESRDKQIRPNAEQHHTNWSTYYIASKWIQRLLPDNTTKLKLNQKEKGKKTVYHLTKKKDKLDQLNDPKKPWDCTQTFHKVDHAWHELKSH